jgi:hypothetical protein
MKLVRQTGLVGIVGIQVEEKPLPEFDPLTGQIFDRACTIQPDSALWVGVLKVCVNVWLVHE